MLNDTNLALVNYPAASSEASGTGLRVYTGAAEPQFRRGVSHYSGTAGTTLPVVRAT
jgi:hypothetical protein